MKPGSVDEIESSGWRYEGFEGHFDAISGRRNDDKSKAIQSYSIYMLNKSWSKSEYEIHSGLVGLASNQWTSVSLLLLLLLPSYMENVFCGWLESSFGILFGLGCWNVITVSPVILALAKTTSRCILDNDECPFGRARLCAMANSLLSAVGVCLEIYIRSCFLLFYNPQ